MTFSRLGKMRWIKYSRCTDSTGKTKTRKEISKMWKTILLEEKSLYGNIQQK
ncbi:hypothetical protein ACOSQ4_027083 [Xanthoceras sorbifolium]